MRTVSEYANGGTFYWRVAAADDTALNVGDFTATRSFTLAPFGSSTKMPTDLTLRVRKGSSKIRASGILSPPHPGSEVIVRFYKRKNGHFTLIATKRPTLDTSSAYAARFARPSGGACKIRSVFAGDADHLASSRSVKFRC
jgi:hypothetical protein